MAADLRGLLPSSHPSNEQASQEEVLHFLKLRSSISAKRRLRQASASPLCLMNPARAIMLVLPVILPFSSTYKTTS